MVMSAMEPSTNPSLTSIQQCVVDALAAGATITAAAEAGHIHRVTIYRWMKTLPQFQSALQRARSEFVLARRDDLHYLSSRALATLLAILDNPKASPSVLLKTSIFILQRPLDPKTAWTMPEPLPENLPEISDEVLAAPDPEPSCNTMQHNSVASSPHEQIMNEFYSMDRFSEFLEQKRAQFLASEPTASS